MRRDEETRAGEPVHPLRAIGHYLTSPLHTFCRRRSSLTLSISFAGMVLLVETLRPMFYYAWTIVLRIGSHNPWHGYDYCMFFAGHSPALWERLAMPAAYWIDTFSPFITAALAWLVVCSPRRAGIPLLIIVLTSIASSICEVMASHIYSFYQQFAGAAPPTSSTPIASVLLSSFRPRLGRLIVPTTIAFWYLIAIRRHLGQGVEHAGRLLDPAPPGWRLLIPVVIAVLAAKYGYAYSASLGNLTWGLLTGQLAGSARPEFWMLEVLLALLALGSCICFMKSRHAQPALWTLAVVAWTWFVAYLRVTPTDLARALFKVDIPVIVTITTLFYHAQNNDWTGQRHDVCGACGYFVGGADGLICPECGAARPPDVTAG